MRVIVAGAVAWADAGAIRRELSKLPPGAVVIHGDCPGADALAGEVARELGFAVEPMAKNAADRVRYKRAAWKGLNELMLASGAALVLMFHPTFDASKGSKHLAELAARRGRGARVRRLRLRFVTAAPPRTRRATPVLHHVDRELPSR